MLLGRVADLDGLSYNSFNNAFDLFDVRIRSLYMAYLLLTLSGVEGEEDGGENRS